jgi:kumamolisin
MPSILKKIGRAALAACLLVSWPAAAAAVGPRTLTGHVPRQIRSATRLARLAADEKVDLSLFVAVDQALLDQTMAEIYGPGAPANRRFLTSDEFSQKFDLARKRQALKDFAAASGLAIDPAEDRPGSLVVRVSGPASRVENAFGVQLRRYRAPDGQVFRGHETEPVIPGALAPHLRAVLGLSDFRGAAKPHLRAGGRIPDGVSALPASGGAAPAAFPGNGPGGSLTPADIKSIYGLSLPLTGTGQTVAVMELDGYNPADITAYEANTSIFPSNPNTPVTFVGVDGQLNTCGAAPTYPNQDQPCNAKTYSVGYSTGDGGMLEVALDIDMMISLAPGVAQIQVYTALNSNLGIIDAYARIASDNTSKSISTSWGLDELDSGGAFMAAEATSFQQMALQGQTIFAAAGDAGAYDNDGASTPVIVVTDDPAAQPYVSGVGGTTLAGSIASHSESVWNEGCSSPGTNCRNNGAGGGGVANYTEGSTAYWPLPTYQSGVAGTNSQQYRNVPDVALNSDPNTFPYVSGVAGNLFYSGGTSAAAPLWAAVMALVNQKRASNGYGPMGFANTAFYQLGTGASYSSYFNDITSGNNGFYFAGNGYDNVTGWGSFKADALINVLSTPLAPAKPVSGLNAFTMGISSVQYSWNALAGATGYNVYYATGGPTPLLVLQTPSPSYTQKGLIGNETSGIFVYGENQGIVGPGAFITTATYAGPPGAPPVATAFSSSAAFTYAACPAFPAPSSCSGYVVQAALANDFSGPTFSSASLNAAPVKLTVAGLATNTGYFFRLGYLNPNGSPTFAAPGVADGTLFTGSPLVAPTSPVFDQITTSAIRFGWNQSTNPAGITYLAQASTAANYSGTLFSLSGTALVETFGGLTGDASYYFRVQGVGGPFMTAGPQATLAAAPAVSTNSFPVVTATSLTLAWSGAVDQPDTLYQADLSPAPDFSSGLLTTKVRVPVAVFPGLTANTVYYARVEAIGRLGGVTAEIPLGSTTTLVLAPTVPGAPFSGLTTGGFTFAFNGGANPPGTRYLVRVSTDPGFTVISASSNTAGSSAAFTSLLSNQLYNVDVAGLNQAGSPTAFAVGPTTATAVGAPLAAGVPITTETTTGLGFRWSAAGLAPGTTYVARLSSSPAFAFGVASSATANAFAAFAGLQPNTTYYGQVQAVSLSVNPDGPFLSPAAAGATLPNPPLPVGSPFTLVSFTSATVAWKALPLAPSSAAAEGYLVEFSTALNFATISASSAVAPGASSATVTGLTYATTYYARVGSVGWEGLTSTLFLGQTYTLLPPLSSGTVSAAGLSLTMPSAFSQLNAISVYVPPGAFPVGTQVSAVALLGMTLTGAQSNEARGIVPFGPTVGIDLSAGGLQPASPVRVMMAYDPTQVPAGQHEAQLKMWRYDPAALQWTLVPSNVDAVAHVLTAFTPHFSTFAPFFVAAGTDVSAVQVFPQPWEIGDSASQYWSTVLTFSGLPASATVKIYTIMGELVWSGTAAASGILTWDGANRFGRKAASGTYYAAFQNGGQTQTRRLVIIR